MTLVRSFTLQQNQSQEIETGLDPNSNSTSNSNVPIETISVDDAYHKASTDRTFPYGIEDLNILLGDFKGNYEKLKKLSGINFSKIRSI